MPNLRSDILLNAKAFVLLFITIGLLGLYAWSTFHIMRSALLCNGGSPPPTGLICEVSQRLATLTTTLQSLVSAVVITVLAISPAKGPLNLLHFGITSPSQSQSAVPVVLAFCYLAVWFIIGATALGVGYIILDNETAVKFSALTDVGGSWLGLAVGAVYAYFGIEQPPPK